MTVRSSHRNINPAYVHLPWSVPFPACTRSWPPLTAVGGLLAGCRGCGAAACPPQSLLSPSINTSRSKRGPGLGMGRVSRVSWVTRGPWSIPDSSIVPASGGLVVGRGFHPGVPTGVGNTHARRHVSSSLHPSKDSSFGGVLTPAVGDSAAQTRPRPNPRNLWTRQLPGTRDHVHMTEPNTLGREEYPGSSSDGEEAQRQGRCDGVRTLTGGAAAKGSGGPGPGGAGSPLLPGASGGTRFRSGRPGRTLASEP